jgi:hypothetical protein
MNESTAQQTTPALWCVDCGCDMVDDTDLGAAMLLDEAMDAVIHRYHSTPMTQDTAPTDDNLRCAEQRGL